MSDLMSLFLGIWCILSKSFLEVCFLLNSRALASVGTEGEEVGVGEKFDFYLELIIIYISVSDK